MPQSRGTLPDDTSGFVWTIAAFRYAKRRRGATPEPDGELGWIGGGVGGGVGGSLALNHGPGSDVSSFARLLSLASPASFRHAQWLQEPPIDGLYDVEQPRSCALDLKSPDGSGFEKESRFDGRDIISPISLRSEEEVPPAPPPRHGACMCARRRDWGELGLPVVTVGTLALLCVLCVRRHNEGWINMEETHGVLSLLCAWSLWTACAWGVGATGVLATGAVMSSWPGTWLSLMPVLCIVAPALSSSAVRGGLIRLLLFTDPVWMLALHTPRAWLSLGLIMRWKDGDFSHLLAASYALPDFSYGVASIALLIVLLVPGLTLSRATLGMWHVVGIYVASGIRKVGADWRHERAMPEMASSRSALQLPLLIGTVSHVPLLALLNALTAWVYLVKGEVV
ncbi:hypothetical protein T492DRAFT_1132729 [Pavlovales sp. CCMP2436]|nr:hypothetical protein T492DRAFT_1132729 [Pavlovales sp. CCMP2436]